MARTGEVFIGTVAMVEPQLSGDFATLMEWADKVRRLKVRTNAETPLDADTARKFGAEGIGLCRTEHMFFDPARIGAVRQMILSETEDGRREALARLLPFQRAGFRRAVPDHGGAAGHHPAARPAAARVPAAWRRRDRRAGGVSSAPMSATMQRRAADLSEANPMLGHRGCRLGITYPEIYEMQARAIFEAAVAVGKESGAAPVPEIMIPLVATRRELEITRAQVDKVAQEVFAETGHHIEYYVGTMIELPRAALTADKIAEVADFFSFGTNDLTQTIFGLSRDDAGKFLPLYVEKGILPKDPFVSHRHRRRRRAGEDRQGEGPLGEARPQARHLRRAWRRPGLDPVLRGSRAGLRLLLALPRAGGAAGGGAGGADWRRRRPHGIIIPAGQ